MGNMFDIVTTFLRQCTEFPIKRKPICFYRHEDFHTTGEKVLFKEDNPENDNDDGGNEDNNTFKRIQIEFFQHLIELRKNQTENNGYSAVRNFPGWTSMTIENLHSLFVLFNSHADATITFKKFALLLDYIGDESSEEFRREKFHDAVTDGSGCLTYDTFLTVMYNFNPQEGSTTLTGLAKLCLDIAESIDYVNKMSIGIQLQNGFF